MSKPQPQKPSAEGAPAAPEAAPGTSPVDPAQLARELERAQREVAEARVRARVIEEAAMRRIDELTEERDAAAAAAERAEAELRRTPPARETPRPTRGDVPVRLRALCGIAFTLGTERKRLRTGEVIEARPEELEDDNLVVGQHFEFAR